MPPGLLQLLTAGAPLLFGLFGRGGQEDIDTSIPPEIRSLLMMSMLGQARQQALVDPAASQIFGFGEPFPDAVPLRSAANQLAFSLLPNFVRPSNSLFPGVAPPTQQIGLPRLGDPGADFEGDIAPPQFQIDDEGNIVLVPPPRRAAIAPEGSIAHADLGFLRGSDVPRSDRGPARPR